ncbi:hypothetical protein AMTRI_Chr04g181570 [Amborella trichopoda]
MRPESSLFIRATLSLCLSLYGCTGAEQSRAEQSIAVIKICSLSLPSSLSQGQNAHLCVPSFLPLSRLQSYRQRSNLS